MRSLQFLFVRICSSVVLIWALTLANHWITPAHAGLVQYSVSTPVGECISDRTYPNIITPCQPVLSFLLDSELFGNGPQQAEGPPVRLNYPTYEINGFGSAEPVYTFGNPDKPGTVMEAETNAVGYLLRAIFYYPIPTEGNRYHRWTIDLGANGYKSSVELGELNRRRLFFNYSGFVTVTTDPELPPIPIPAALPLFLSGLGLLGFVGWRRREGRAR